jgi:hypothetical protein
MKQVHHEIFNFLKGIIPLWYESAETTDGRSKGISKPPFRKPTIAEGEDEVMT